MSFDPDAVASDEEDEEAAIDADGQGVWDHAYCAVCDRLIEPSQAVQETRDDKSEVDEDEWVAAAMSSLRRHAQPMTQRGVSPHTDRHDEARPGGSLFCSERCRKIDKQSNARMGEFLKYVSSSSPSLSARHEAESLRGADSDTQPDSPPEEPSVLASAKPAVSASLSTSLLRAESRSHTVHQATDDEVSHDTLADRPLAKNTVRYKPRTSSMQGPSNLARSRLAMRTQAMVAPLSAATMPSMASASIDPSSPVSTDEAALFAGTPPPSVMFGEPTGAEALPAVPKTSPTSHPSASFSPLSLMSHGTGLRTEPIAAVEENATNTLWDASTQMERHGTATDALRKAQLFADSPEPMENVSRPTPRRGSITSLSSGRGKGPLPSASALHMPSRTTTAPPSSTSSESLLSQRHSLQALRRGSEGDAMLETMEHGTPHSARTERGASRRARDVRHLPPLFGPPRSKDEEARPASLRGSMTRLDSASPLLPSRNSFYSTSAAHSQPGTSPRRAGLGWSALPSSSTKLSSSMNRTASMEDDIGGSLRSLPQDPRAMSASMRTWSYDRLPGMRMYPLMQLPGAPVHDTYQQPLPLGTAAPAETASRRVSTSFSTKPRTGSISSTGSGASGARRKTLFYFAGS